VRDDGLELDPYLRRQVTLLDYVEELERPLVVPPRPRKEALRSPVPGKDWDRRPWRTRIVHPD
jgi:hypothetical protein